MASNDKVFDYRTHGKALEVAGVIGIGIAVFIMFLRPNSWPERAWTITIGVIFELFLLLSAYKLARVYKNAKVILNNREIIGIDSNGREYARAPVTEIRGREYSNRGEYDVLLDKGAIEVGRNIRDLEALTAAIKAHEIENTGSAETTRRLHDARVKRERRKGIILVALGFVMLLGGIIVYANSRTVPPTRFASVACISAVIGIFVAIAGAGMLANADLDV